MIDHIHRCARKFSLVLTKIDKISKNQINYQNRSMISLMKNYKKTFGNIFFSETKKNSGIIDIQKIIYEISQ